ncbi:hydantoinase B/oxoprolinase family protein [bacterium]|nr:hydantoinase B/oxoprolinase family protein [bacterium]UNM06929.1 MAG: hydantoinase B/oxoprolinase family protein [Planctomycetales bacterium]
MADLNKNRDETETGPEHDGLDPLHVATGADSAPRGLLRIAADTGGTFTDLVLTDEHGRLLLTHKLLSTPDDPSRAVLEGVQMLLAMSGRDMEPYELIHGTTVATNAMLTRSGARVGLVVNKGMEGLLGIGRQNRPELYALHPRRGAALVRPEDVRGIGGPEQQWVAQMQPDYRRQLELEGLLSKSAWAISAIGPNQELESRFRSQLMELLPTTAGVAKHVDSIRQLYEQLKSRKLSEDEESTLAEISQAMVEGIEIHTSMDIAPDALEFERCCTTVANAMVARMMKQYLAKLDEGEQQQLSIMASDGGLVPVSVVSYKPVLTMLSGPAGGALGALQAGQDCGITKLVTFDMGGTSTDVALLDNGLPLARTMEIDNIPLRLPHIDIHTVGAGGGSIAWIDSGGALKVGPQSAGADPGPACYGRQKHDEPLATVTDAHVVLGHLPEEVRLAGKLELDRVASDRVVNVLAKQLGLAVEDCAEGILRIADQNMANAIRAVSSQRGHDPRQYTLVPFGGAGGLHAVRLAELLGMRRILLPASPGLLSAVGMLSAPLRFSRSRRVELAMYSRSEAEFRRDELYDALATLDRHIEQMTKELESDVQAADRDTRMWSSFRTLVDVRYAGQDHELTVDWNARHQWDEDFHRLHEQLYGHCHLDRALEIVSVHVSVEVSQGQGVNNPVNLHASTETRLSRVVQRDDLLPLQWHTGPLTLMEQSATTTIPAGWDLRVVDNGHILIEKTTGTGDLGPGTGKQVAANREQGSDPIELEIFRQLFAAVAEEMGNSLMRTAHSPNINQRRDFSCAIFDEQARMIAQAAHIPVHLGSMGTAVQAVLERFPLAEMDPDAHYIVNDPFSGGTHLPDITIVSPVVPLEEDLPRFLVASRAHHSDVGGISPGSLPLSRHIDEEGIRIEPALYDKEMQGRICTASRTPQERLGDLNAQIASQLTGRRRLIEMCGSYGWEHVSAMATTLLQYSARMMREVVAAIPDGTFEAEDFMDGDGLEATDVAIRVKLTVAGDELTADFTGTDEQVPGSINAVRAITLSALGYVLRLLAPAELPQNEGAMQPLKLVTRPGSLVDAQYPAAVAAGNVETSQRITDVLMQALAKAMPERMPACSQGTMNNVLIGGVDPRTGQPFSYYETIGGGCGAGPDGPGESAIHSHMTNTLNTPIETIARRYPFRVVEYHLARGTGGEGLHRGGDGLVRTYEFDAPATVTLITERRRHSPPGANGGQPGSKGANILQRADGTRSILPGKCTIEVEPGEQLEIVTPGGGGWGSPGQAE